MGEQSKASMPQLSRPKRAQVVTIFDWDDTLLCTTHLEAVQRQYGAIPVHVRDQLAQLEKVVHQILVQAMAAGKVFIITNASEGWVQHSSGRWKSSRHELASRTPSQETRTRGRCTPFFRC